MRVKMFTNYSGLLEKEINEWLKTRTNISIYFIGQSSADYMTSISIWYEKQKQSEEKIGTTFSDKGSITPCPNRYIAK